VNVAHLILYIAEGGSYIDIVSPLSAVSEEYRSLYFTDTSLLWSESECAGAHQLKWELSDYSTLLAESTSPSDDWESSTGLQSPLFITSGISVTDLSLVDDVFTLVGTVTNMTESTVTYVDTSSGSTTCSYRELVLNKDYDDDDADDDVVVTSTVVRYIRHDSTNQGSTGYTLSDWESLHDEIYAAQKVLSDQGEATWSRYLDTHMGLQSPNSETCSKSVSLLDEAYAALSNEYVTSKRTNLHYYTGVPGIMSWEFNAKNCDTDDDTCGCIENNSYIAYSEKYGENCW
jgi:hypothetical protein